SPYQIAFALKLAGFAAILGIAARNKLRWTGMLRTDPPRARTGLRRSLLIETVVAVSILSATALVTSFPPAA
ncbi:MAG: CopD family protein, partial [Pseudomonadota bacterium]